jgi:hypothetical protein
MKALSILQPWAWLIVSGHKDIENRSWPTKIRGEFLIHAGKGFDTNGWMWLVNNWYRQGLPSAIQDLYDQELRGKFSWKEHRGGIVGKATITDCVIDHPSPWKNDGAYGFVLIDAKPLPFRPLRGALGFFDVPDA